MSLTQDDIKAAENRGEKRVIRNLVRAFTAVAGISLFTFSVGVFVVDQSDRADQRAVNEFKASGKMVTLDKMVSGKNYTIMTEGISIPQLGIYPKIRLIKEG